ncbi:MAG: SUF system NifU family Fe-S cluster assembly protein [Acidobacteria bacterium]|nr:SUF system NifU family Fe-S cluster assembly protein [Acidobacteriota bacterium]MXW37445.1 SUF system NifU family Fe-S cluster assembly protein [Acidobacteriota bacterium]MXZ61887.1 SUF system NifU family Fe-S cluster assembly protein [Acidobacteriota bacterium]MYA45928.1 SUF system NifU family Fe-S cluster assembly protein [Acidobacteriota bacterium]MYB32765.1 SUF system NifU family Fe-S cluster assembly protein [Acidobacteriota bacterium]
MNDALRDLYREVILDHSRRPRNYGAMDAANRQSDGFNPLCGDRLRLFLLVEDGAVRQASFVGDGCAISTASASLLTEAARGLPEEEALQLVENFRGMVSGEGEPDGASLGKLTVFAGVRDYPTRVKCATLAWHTLRAAIEQSGETVKTE